MSIRWGIVGCGKVCEVKSGPAFQKAEGSELVAVMRRDVEQARDFARRHGVPTVHATAEALISDPNVDAVYIATPPGSHCELALQVAAAGKPAYVEKPMARNHAECTRMVEAFARARQPLFVAYYRRALPRFLKVKEVLASGVLGTLRSVDVRYTSNGQSRLDRTNLPWRVCAEQSGGGLFLDLASHTLDVLDFLLGPLESVRGDAWNVSRTSLVEDRVSLEFVTPSGAKGAGLWDFTSSAYEDRIVFNGALGTLTLSTFGDGPIQLSARAGTETWSLPNPPHIQQPLVQSIVDALVGRGACSSSGESAARTSLVMDRALAGYYGSREDEFWATPSRWSERRGSGQVPDFKTDSSG
ncbi:MAG TPA: Gfo/Idh/MocA family oxidoreductase [Polyangiaceae bacterium]|nr:Gfo/Idh/MocA family oxidoreductase [Polyangiaceae bacterium]